MERTNHDNKPIMPVEFGGYGRQAGPPGSANNLKDVEFSSRFPPDIQPNTRIVAVCGVNDYEDGASPSNDGWFLSDFFLFYHLFSGLGSNQLWLSCVSPKDLVNKYTEYAHGNRFEKRRIVLDSSFLPAMGAAQNIRIFPPEDLCERFLATVRSECRIAQEQDQPVLLLVFGHGDEDTHGVAIGGRHPETAPRLTINSVKVAIGRHTQVAILLTSCYSGGWIVKPRLNVTAMTAAGVHNQSESWAKSASVGRSAGSIYATAVLMALIKMEDPRATQHQSYSLENINEEEVVERSSSSTYAELSRVIFQTLQEDVDKFWIHHDIKFSAQDDVWEREWRQRSGIPLNYFHQRWDMLRSIPMDNTSDPMLNRDPKSVESFQTAAAGAAPEQGFFGSLRASQSRYSLRTLTENRDLNTDKDIQKFRRVVETQARDYLSSYPGNDHFGSNNNHGRIRELLRGKDYDLEMLQYLSRVLMYRMSSQKLASDYKDFLALQFPDCIAIDVDTYNMVKGVEKTQEARGIMERVNIIRPLTAKMFPSPPPDAGLTYDKPRSYLAIALAESKMPLAEVEGRLDDLKTLSDARVANLANRVSARKAVRDAVNTFLKKLKRRSSKSLQKPSPPSDAE